MAGKSLFGRDDDDEKDDDARPDEPRKQPEGVRLIEPDKVPEVAEKESTVKRRGGDIPKYGDRPASPPSDKKATIRLPLAGSADLNAIERPKPAPHDRPVTGGSTVGGATGGGPTGGGPTGSSTGASGSGGGSEPPTQVTIAVPTAGSGQPAEDALFTGSTPVVGGGRPSDQPDEGSRRKRRKERRRERGEGDRGDAVDRPLFGGDEEIPELERLDTGDTGPAPAPAAPRPAEPAASTGAAGVDAGASEPPPAERAAGQPIISVGPPTGEVSLPHWTEPATGEVPKIIIGDAEDEAAEQAAWDTFAGAGPRYRDQHDSWDDSSITDLIDEDDGDRLGALAAPDEDLVTQDEFLTLEDLEMPDAEMPRPPTRGSVADPVRQGKAGHATGSTPSVRVTKRVGPRAASAPSRGDDTSGRMARPRVPTGENKTVSERLGVAAPTGPAAPDEGGGRNIKVAIAVGVPMGLAAWWLFAKGPSALGVAIITAVIAWSGVEFFAAVATRRFKPVWPVGLAALAALPVAAYTSGEVAIPLVLFLTVFFGFLWYILGLSTQKPLGNLGVTFFAVAWIGVFGCFASLIFRIGPVLKDGTFTEIDQGPSILIMAIAVSVASDAGALLWGKLYGRRTFTPISPHKTIEGLIGGVVTAVVIVTIASVKFGPFGVAGTAFFALCCAVAAPIGDLAESLIKRDIGLKDMSDTIPGHGGVLDRFDALLFVLPVAYFVTRLLIPGIPWF